MASHLMSECSNRIKVMANKHMNSKLIIENPVFSSQTKEALSSNILPNFCEIKNATMKSVIDKLDLTTEIISLIKAKEISELEKSESKRKKSRTPKILKTHQLKNQLKSQMPLLTLGVLMFY